MENFSAGYVKVQQFVSNRWLSIVPVSKRILELLPMLKVYFLKNLPKDNPRLIKNDGYKSIKKMFKCPLTPVYLNFLISVGSILEEMLKLFQEKGTLIHILYDELSKLLLKLMRCFLNESALTDKYGEDLVDVDVRKEAVALKYLDVGNSTRKLLQQLSLD